MNLNRTSNLIFKHTILSISVSIFAFLGCVQNEPIKVNTPNFAYVGELPESYYKIEKGFPQLAHELKKLPDVVNGISQDDNISIDTIFWLGKKYPEKIEKMFAEMYSIGIPEHRKYCAPLEAFFWICQESKNSAETIILNYNLNYLLSEAWNFKSTYTKNELEKIVDNITENYLRDMLLKVLEKERYDIVEKQINRYQDSHQHYFNEDAKNIISKRKEASKWNSFDVVIDRLNAPELLSWWMKKNITYGWDGYPNESRLVIRNPQQVFEKKEGECLAQSAFQNHALKKNGYNTKYIYVDRPSNSGDHHICYWVEDGNYFYLENAFQSYKGIYGPFKSLNDVAANVYNQLTENDGRRVGYKFVRFSSVPFGIKSNDFRKSLGAEN